MLAEVSLLLLILFTWLQLAIIILASNQKFRERTTIIVSLQTLTLALVILCGLAFLGLIIGFVLEDFSIAYVVGHSNTSLPWFYKISAAWGGHEGSMLLWILVATLWQYCFCRFSNNLDDNLKFLSIAIMGIVILLITIFVLLTSNPFARLLPISPLDGSDLNPLLQDIGLILHPPMLYIGYVGTIVPFAISLAAMFLKLNYRQWSNYLQPWISTIWGFLTLGIGLGSWWAYHELGWGGWWFWDPVENVSLMPWLVLTVLIHWASPSSKGNVYSKVVPFLAVLPFCLVLLGLFTVRSGILTSIHSFASSPERGLYLLVLLVMILATAMLIYARRTTINSPIKPLRFLDILLFVQGAVLLTVLFVVFLGTFYPLFYEVLGLGFLSVGAPYFNQFVLVLVLPTIFLMPLILWYKNHNAILISAISTLALALIISYSIASSLATQFNVTASIGIWAGLFITSSFLWQLFLHIKQHLQLSLNNIAIMQIAHIGFGLLVLAISANSYAVSYEVLLKPNEKTIKSGYEFTYIQADTAAAVNYIANTAKFKVTKDNVSKYILTEKRNYHSGTVTTEVGIISLWWADIYLTIGQKSEQASSFKLQILPLSNLLWLSIILLAIAGLLRSAVLRIKN